MRRLNAWMEGAHVGVFSEDDEGRVSFEYDDDAPDFPISLSLPRGGGWVRRNPERFLDNLLPDSPEARLAMKRATGAEGADSFSLLDGADATGGLVFSSKEEMPDREREPAVRADDDAIAYRIATMRNAPGAWWQTDDRIRFSLAGSQPKFSLARIGSHWAWSNAANPSTHILKPAPIGDEGDRTHGTRDADKVEAASMRLAALCGLDTPKSGLIAFAGEPAYIVERFDRYALDDGSVGRIHTEDMMQALGLPPRNKYGVKAKDILRVLHAADTSNRLSYDWIRQLALNVSIGNADAHAKNYSLMLRPDSIDLTPMYDVITTTYWPKVDRTLPMSIGGARGAVQITPHHWERLALDNDLDPDMVVYIARATAGRVLSRMDEAYDRLPPEMAEALEAEIRKANRNIDPIRSDGGSSASLYDVNVDDPGTTCLNRPGKARQPRKPRGTPGGGRFDFVGRR